ncbi:hypothetical protein DICPUDRAFT_91024 [Dictyostelium purpureum]|uniref:Lipoprotein n=1 Tax=Dictyostelium purpureum TaxID=5786 RepID=F0Z6J6_DICPU|nr:uncharacterized protein DICPUDRAFT_91024 [Dictyostelium purpureum]EGC40503.1 hypothetical protein DICPUDRAFT_91024 [Dictyostelium purpureum]|eukprot:XP_003283050.1 hypothetical protein DICPUDRAFT_91024 [Dictyostelium purpureum]
MNFKEAFLLFTIVLSAISTCYASLNIQQGSTIPNVYTGMSSRQKKDASEAIALIVYSKIFYNNQGTIANYGSIRIDMQGVFTSGGQRFHNIQAQVNGISGKSTVAHVAISEQTMSSKSNEQAFVQRKFRDTMLKSLSSGKSYTITGTPN